MIEPYYNPFDPSIGEFGKRGGSHFQNTGTVIDSANVDIEVPPPDVVGAANAAGFWNNAAAIVLAGAQTLAAKIQGDKNIEMVRQQREFIKSEHDLYRDRSMGGQEALIRARYIDYIASFTRSFPQMISIGENHIANLQTAITNSDNILNELFDKRLRDERLGNLATLRTEQITDADIDSANRIQNVTLINDANTELAQAKENAINIAFKEESQRIDTEEGNKGYIHGDGLRDKLLLSARLIQQDGIAINNKGTNLENVDRLESLKAGISERDFVLGEGNRDLKFKIGEDDVNKRLTGVGAPGEKIIQNNEVVGDAPENLALNAWKRRFDRGNFKHEATPIASSPVPDVEAPLATGVAALGNFVSGSLRRGTQSNQGFPSTSRGLGF